MNVFAAAGLNVTYTHVHKEVLILKCINIHFSVRNMFTLKP